ncbi:MAG TPA: hypothetical protein VMT00_03275 [Thermoanaerobaculia bacterium]|nr:hypothetical protein [Thermoanaerobaculia bacterium]
MTSLLRRESPWVLAGLAAAAAAWLAVRGRALTPVDEALPLLALLIVTSAWVVRHSVAGEAILGALPLLLVASFAVPQEELRLACYGLLVTVAFGAALVRASTGSEPPSMIADGEPSDLRGGERADPGGAGLTAGSAVVLLAVGFAAMRLTAAADHLVPALVFAGGAMLLLAASAGRPIRLTTLLIVLVTMVVTPLAPARAALFPILLGLLVWHLRRPHPLTAAGALVVAVLCGRWAIPLALVPIISRFLLPGRSSGGALLAAVVPLRSIQASILLRVAVFHPAAILDLLRADPARRVVAILLVVIAVFLRPSLALLYLLASIVFLSADAGREGEAPERWLPPLLILLLLTTHLAWGGALLSVFPLPLSPPALLFIVATALLPLLIARRMVRAAGVSALLLLVIIAVVAAGGRFEPFVSTNQVSLRAGEAASFSVHRNEGRIAVVLSGAHMSALAAGTPVGVVEAIGEEGRGVRREVRVGELADWASLRSDQAFFSRNPFPDDPAGRIAGHGASSFLTGAGRIAIGLEAPIILVRVTAGELPPDVRLQVEGIEVRK